MKLDIWMLVKRLEKYSPAVIASSGERRIEGARLFAQNSTPDLRYVYVTGPSDNDSPQAVGEILLMNGNDVISIHGFCIEEVYNDVIAAFEFYNAWEYSLLLAASSRNPEQRIIDACAGIIDGVMFMMDLNCSLVSFSGWNKVGEVGKIWDEFMIEHESSLDSLRLFQNNELFRLLPLENDCRCFDETVPWASPYCHGIAISYGGAGKGLLAQMVLAFKDPVTPYEMSLARAVQAAMRAVPSPTIGTGGESYIASIFSHAFEQGRMPQRTIERVKFTQHWDTDDYMAVATGLAETGPDDDRLLHAYMMRFNIAFVGSVTFETDGKLVTCMNLAALGTTPDGIAAMLAGHARLLFGISPQFADLGELALYARQALDALAYCEEGRVSMFGEHVLDVLAHESDRDYCIQCCHPIVSMLREYDTCNSTDLARTLWVFLRCERSYVLAGSQLYLNRNTILQRIKRIESICPVDLDDPDTREYILLSYRLLQPMPHGMSDL